MSKRMREGDNLAAKGDGVSCSTNLFTSCFSDRNRWMADFSCSLV